MTMGPYRAVTTSKQRRGTSWLNLRLFAPGTSYKEPRVAQWSSPQSSPSPIGRLHDRMSAGTHQFREVPLGAVRSIGLIADIAVHRYHKQQRKDAGWLLASHHSCAASFNILETFHEEGRVRLRWITFGYLKKMHSHALASGAHNADGVRINGSATQIRKQGLNLVERERRGLSAQTIENPMSNWSHGAQNYTAGLFASRQC